MYEYETGGRAPGKGQETRKQEEKYFIFFFFLPILETAILPYIVITSSNSTFACTATRVTPKAVPYLISFANRNAEDINSITFIIFHVPY